jgi:outer membrane cobalamin receptor
MSHDTSSGVTANDLEWLVPVSAGTVPAFTAGVFLADPASPGQYVQPFLRGIDWRGTTVLVDGVPMNDRMSGILNLSMIPLELIEQMEIVTGPQSFFFGTGSPGGVINIVSKKASRVVPSTKVRYEESSYGYAFSDGSFNQNISRRLNLAFGYQFQGTDGRFRNSAHEQWNFRGSVRYHLTTRWSLSYRHLYTQSRTGLNEGIDLAATGSALAFVPQQALVRNPDAYEKLTRHDGALSLQGTLFADTTSVTDVTLFATHILREYRDEENPSSAAGLAVQPTNGVFLQEDHRLAWYAMQVRQRVTAGPVVVLAGLRGEEDQVYGSPTVGRQRRPAFAAWIGATTDVNSWLTLSINTRSDAARGTTKAGLGGEVTVRMGHGWTASAAYATSQRPPTLTEQFWSDTTIIREGVVAAERHHHAESAIVWHDDDNISHARIALWRHSVENPILTEDVTGGGLRTKVRLYQGPRSSIDGIEADVRFRVGPFQAGGTATYLMRVESNGGPMNALPRTSAQGFLYYRSLILGGALDLQAGVRARFRSAFNGSLLLGEQLLSVPNTRTTLGMASSLDLVLVARLGDAYVHILWDNITDTQYFTTPFTPAQDRSLRFGVSWNFLN